MVKWIRSIGVDGAIERARNRVLSSVWRGLALPVLALGLLWPSLASAQHTSTVCSAKTATVASGGTVTINITDCEELPGFGGIGPIDGGSSLPPNPDFEDHGTATLRQEPGVGWFLDYSHNGATGIGGTDVFEFADGSMAGDGDVQVTISITASASPITVSPGTLPTLTAGTPFSQTLTATGGLAPYTYSVQSGSLPAGVSLSSGGVLSGTPTHRGAYSFSVRATDSTMPTAQFVDKGYTGNVNNPTLTMSPTSGTAIQGIAFSQTLSTSGGVAPYSYLHESGLPSGIALSSGGVLSGTTSAAPGNYPVSIRVTDSSTGPGSYFELETFNLTVSPAPTVSVSVSPASVSEDGATNLVYTVTRSLNLSSPTVVNLTTSGTATAGADFTGQVTTVTIPSGATTATVTINPTADATIEPDETVILTATPGTGYTIGAPSSATGTILNDDVPSASITVSPAAVAEDGASNLVYTVTLNQAPLSAVTVNYTPTGTAGNGTDYATIGSSVTIAANSTTGTITVNPTTDATGEADETVILTLASGTGYTVGAPSSATGTILNDDDPALTINDVSLTEGDAGAQNLTFTVSLSMAAGPGGVSFDIATANGTAVAGVDYVATSATGQTIAAGNSTSLFSVPINGDTLNEANETFFVNVTNVVNATVVDSQGIGTINNDDPLPSLSINDTAVVEGNAGPTATSLTVTLSPASGQTVSVDYASANGTATAGSDYTAVSGTLTFAPGETTKTINLTVYGESTQEANETFSVTLSNPTNATTADSVGEVTITNDDVSLTILPASLPSGVVGLPYAQPLSASGGTAPYSFAHMAGALPPGISVTGGQVSGTPTMTGTFTFAVNVQDSSAAPGPYSSNRIYNMTVGAPTIVLSPNTLPSPVIGAAYSQTLTASGGTAPYAFYVNPSNLPAGLTLSAGGLLSGTPTEVGSFNFTITAVDQFSQIGSQAYAMTIAPPTLSLSPAGGPVTMTYGSPAELDFVASGSPGPFTYAFGGAPIPGLTFSGNKLSGTPSAPGVYPFTITATDSVLTGAGAPFSVLQSYSLTVGAPTYVVSPATLPGVVAGVAYSQQLTASGGVAPYQFQVTSGALPTGLNLGLGGMLSGTATQVGTFNIAITVTDANSVMAVVNYVINSTATPSQSLTKEVLSNADGDGNGRVSMGDVLTYRVTVSNDGFVPLTNVVVDDPRISPSTTSCGTVLPGGSCVLEGTTTVTADDVRNRRIVNVATATSEVCAAGSQDVRCRVTLTTAVVPAKVQAKNDDFGEHMCPKSDLVVGNAYANDTIDGRRVRASEILGTVTSRATPAQPGKPVPELNTGTGEVTVPAGTPGGSYSIGYRICQRSVSNNCDTATITVKIKHCEVLVRVIKTANTQQTRVGGLVSYTLQIDNLSENGAEVAGLRILDTPSQGFSLVPGSVRFQDRDNRGTVAGTGPFQLDEIDLAGNGRAYITYLMRVGANAVRGTAVNTASPWHEGQQVGTTAKAVVAVQADPDTDETSVIGRVFIDRDGDGWQDSADAGEVHIQGGIDPAVYVAGSTTVDRGKGPEPVPDASAPLLRGLNLGDMAGRRGDDPSEPMHRIVVSQWVTAPTFVGQTEVRSREGSRWQMGQGGDVTSAHQGDVAAGLNGQVLQVERVVTPHEGRFRVDYVITNRGVSELGIPGVRLASPEGLVIQTDSYGRFHLEGIDAAAKAHGRNFVLKLDPVSLPQGARVTTGNPLVRRLTGGLAVRFDFGVSFDAETGRSQ